MKYLPLIWSGIWRKRSRTILTILQIAVAFALFGVLQGMKSGVEQSIASARADLLLVGSKVSMADPLPLSHLQRIESVPGVKAVGIQNVLLANYQNVNQHVPVLATNPNRVWLETSPQLKISVQSLDALVKNRTGALVSEGLAKKYGWKVGDRIPLMSGVAKSDGSTTWTFDMVGTFTDEEALSTSDFVIVNNDYFDEARVDNKGTVQRFSVIINDPKQAAVVADAIDKIFANSPNETRTESLREFAQSQLQSIGDFNFIIRDVVAAVFFALLISTGAMMMQSIRERTGELAVLKTLGFTDRGVLILILIEAAIVCLAAATIGLGSATFAFPWAARFLPGVSMPSVVVVAGLLCALVLALITAALPAMRAARLEVVDALAGR